MSQLSGKKEFGKRLGRERRLKAVRDDRDIENQEVAEAVGVDPASVGRCFRGETMPNDDTLVRLAAYLGVTPAWLRYGQEPRELGAAMERRRVPDPRQTIEKPAAKAAGVRKRGR